MDASDDRFQKKTFTRQSILPAMGTGLANVPGLVRATVRGNVDAEFREKIMLAVTAVNECRYCTWFHTDHAARSGVSEDVVRQILEDSIEDAVGDDELPALQFAQQYAEADANPDPETQETLEDAYDAKTAADILAYVRAIYLANLAGNTVDLLLVRLQGSCGALAERLPT